MLEYFDFRTHVLFLYHHAEGVRNDKNSELADDIIKSACASMKGEAKGDWPEISGLAAQKLAHLGYHDELRKKRFKAKLSKLRRDVTSDNT